MAIANFNDNIDIIPGNFKRTDLRYGFGVIVDGIFSNALFNGNAIALPNPKILPLNPKSITQDEGFATQITPQQDGGLVVESRGQITKSITVAGTTGFLPLRARGNVGTLDGTLGGETVSIGAGLGQKSGYNDFMELRALFREYGRIKRTDPENSGRVQMVFLNGKDNEFWIVEPTTFRGERSTPRSTLYNYNVQLTAIGQFETHRRPTDFIDDPSKASKLVQQVADASAQVTDFADNLEASALIFSGAMNKAVTAILSPARAFASAADSLVNGSATLLDILPSTLNEITVQFKNLLDAVEVVGTTLPLTILEGGFNSWHAVEKIIIVPKAFRQSFSDKWEDVKERWANIEETYESTFRGQRSRRGLSGVREEVVMYEETIQRFAQRTVGDATRFLDIVLLNDLKPPYIVTDKADRRRGTIAAGETLLVPVQQAAEFKSNPIPGTLESVQRSPTTAGTATAGTATTLTEAAEEWITNQWAGFSVEITAGTGVTQVRFIESSTADTLTVSPDWTTIPDVTSDYKVYINPITKEKDPESRLGVDLKLASDWDLIATPASDVELIRGIPNMAQAIDIKLFVEQGELPFHPGFGFGAGIGSKGTATGILTVKAFALRTFLLDSRIDRVDDIRVDFREGRIELTSKVRLKGADSSQFVQASLPG